MEKEDKAPQVSISQRLGLFAYKVMCFLLRMTDVRIVAAIGRGIGYLVWALFPSRRAIVARNFRIILDPCLRADKLSSMVRRNMVRTSMNLACSFKTGLMTERELSRAAILKGKDIFEQSGTDGRTAICCIPHAGNWELLARIRPCCDKVEHFGSMYRRMSNPLLEQFVYKSRTEYGCEMFSKESGLKAVLQFAKNGGCLGVLCDQHTAEGFFLPYFGKMTNVTPLPALLHKRCKGKGTLLAVFTRNISLGKWEVELGHPIDLPADCDSLQKVTMQVTLALEKSQNDNIMDGFWMHHRWKSHALFAAQLTPDEQELVNQYVKLPFRIIVCMPESFEEAVLLVPVLQGLKASRFDAQLTVICPGEQAAFWRSCRDSLVTYVVTTDDKVGVFEQLDSDELYKDGPYDFLFMFSENKKVMRDLQKLKPIFISGFASNPLTKHFKFIVRMQPDPHSKKPTHRQQDYLYGMKRYHHIECTEQVAISGNATCDDSFVAPFSTLGAADSWPVERWTELVRSLQTKGKCVKLLHLPQDSQKATRLAAEWKIETCAAAPEEVSSVVGPQSHLYAVDGLLPQLAALAGCPCTVLMASRLAASYAPIGTGHRVLTNHVACHPCYRTTCNAATGSCLEGVSVAEMLGDAE